MPTSRPIQADDLLDNIEIARILGVSPSSLRAMRAQPDRNPRFREMPAPLRLISGRPIWRRADIEQWIAQVVPRPADKQNG